MYSGDNQVKTLITTEDIKEIVGLFNQKFNESFNLFSFDEQNQFEFLELLNKVFTHLDSKAGLDIKNDNPETLIYKIAEFLRVLNYPCSYDEKWQQAIFQADKKTIYPIFYFLLTRLPEHEKRAYLAKYLVPVQVPEEFQMDNEIKTYLDQIKDLQAEFQVHHQQMEQVQMQSMNPGELKREITQLEQEREQLMTKISTFKGKVNNKQNFQELLEVTNLLRREQEEEARLADKLRQQRSQLEWSDQQLLQTQQRLIDAQKSLAPDNSPEQMLMALRNEVKKNRELSKDRLGFDLKERRRKLEQIEKLLNEPPITLNELNQMENNLMALRRAVNQMEDKLRREAKPDDDKLAIYKQQAQLVTKKKEKAVEDVKKAEEEQQLIEKEVFKKEDQIQKERGPNYKSKDEFKQYANVLKDKKGQFQKLKEEFKGLQAEKTILDRTEQILRRQKTDLSKQLLEFEKAHGIVGYHGMKEGLEKMSEQKGDLDLKKGQTLEEISRIVTEIQVQINHKKPLIQGQLSEIKELRTKLTTLESEHKNKKAEYDRIMVNIESDQGQLATDVKKLREEVYAQDRKIRLTKYNLEILDIKEQRLNDEAEFIKGNKQLSATSASYAEQLKQKLVKLEDTIKNLKAQRENVKENHEPSLRQLNYFNDLKKLLIIKQQVTQNEAANKQGHKQGANRLVIG